MKSQTEILEFIRRIENIRAAYRIVISELNSVENDSIQIEVMMDFLEVFDKMKDEIEKREDLKEFAKKVADMRKNQKSYFKTRAPKFLEDSKKFENEVDETVFQIIRKQTAPIPLQLEIPI